VVVVWGELDGDCGIDHGHSVGKQHHDEYGFQSRGLRLFLVGKWVAGGRIATYRKRPSDIQRPGHWCSLSGVPEGLSKHFAAITSKGRIKGQRYPLKRDFVKRMWARTRRKAGLTNFRFHDYRHDFGTKLLRQTGNLKLVQKALNHRSINSTLRYAHVLDSEVAAAMEALTQNRSTPKRPSQDRQKAQEPGTAADQGEAYPRLRKALKAS
jgi:integrase